MHGETRARDSAIQQVGPGLPVDKPLQPSSVVVRADNELRHTAAVHEATATAAGAAAVTGSHVSTSGPSTAAAITAANEVTVEHLFVN